MKFIKKRKYITTFVGRLLFIMTFAGYYVYKVFPMPSAIRRNRNKWLFASHMGWNSSNNAKCLFIQIRDEDPSIDSIWIARNREEEKQVRQAGFKSFVWYTPKSFFYCLTAGVYLYTEHTKDINRLTSRTAFCACLWHGVGIKKLLGLDSSHYRNCCMFRKEPAEGSFLERMKVPLQIYRKPDALLVPSRFQADELFMPEFRVSAEHIMLAGYPRNELLSWTCEKIRDYVTRYCSQNDLDFLNRITSRKYRKIYIYMPTWRRWTENSLISRAGFDLDELEAALAATDSLFIIKSHMRGKWDIDSTEHIVRIGSTHDVYPLLPYTDCLITDYSSIYSDYILMNKEIILFPFDQEEFMQNSTDLLDYDTYYLGTKVYMFRDLLSLIRGTVDCHLSADDQLAVLRFYQECHENGLNLIQEIKKRHSEFLERKRKRKN